MTGRTRVLLTQINNITSPGFIFVCCGIHKRDLVMQCVYRNALDKKYLTTLNSLIGYLFRQQNLIQYIQRTFLKVALMSWLSMQSTSKWFTYNIIRVQEHLYLKKPCCIPTKHWWVFLFAVNDFEDEARRVFVVLQGLTNFLVQQGAQLSGIVDN